LTEPEVEPTNLTETVVRGVGLAGAGYVLAQVLTLGFYFVLARLATPEDFGEYAAGAVLVSLGLLFTESGMMAALIHRRDRIDEAASTAVIATAVAGAGFALVALAASPLVGAIFDDSTVAAVAAATSGLLFLRSLLVVPQAILQRRFSFLRRVVVEPAGVVAFGIGAVIATANGLGVWGLVIGYYASAVTDVVLSWALVDWRPRFRTASFAMWRELIGYGRHVVATTALLRAEEQIPVVLLGRFVGTGPLGQFRYANRISTTSLALVVQGASYVLFPALARISHEGDRFRDACLRSLRMMAAIAFPLGLVLVPLGLPAAVLLFGDVWKQAGYAAMALAAFPAGATLISFASEVVKAGGRPDIMTRIHIVTLIASTVAMVALLPLDLVGVAAGISLGAAVGGADSLRRVAALLELRIADLVAEIWAPAAAALAMAAVMVPVEFLLVQAHTRAELIGLILLGAEFTAAIALYAGALRALAPQTLADLISMIRRLRPGGRAGGPAEPSQAPATTP